MPWVWRITVSGACWTAPTADDAASCTVPAALDAESCTEPAMFDARCWAVADVSWAEPMTFSFSVLMRPLAAVTRRSTTRAGLTFSLRASTS
ncbi:hypothetical protein [Blastococcus brunescens]|uniref:Secreted protein n=1 Tax=Blastococcus brunescens TaxID=1564165 RepID=A0ABZ1B9C5_9ACTN|nr:hypothetical protein [Blastococcus sp. BMG 8361]WRL67349.1 hypothetical protein U6N30_05605 [Blastococcus sp. BMG 8361]